MVVNMRGPFAQIPPFEPGKFALAGAAIVEGADRPKVKYRGVKVMTYDEHSLTQIDEYPDATGWAVDERGQLDVYNVDSENYDVASYPHEVWKRAWFPGAEERTRFLLPGEDENGEVPDVEPHEG